MASRLPNVTPENFNLGVVLATRCPAQQGTIDLLTHVYEQVVHKDHNVLEDDARMLAFFSRTG